MPSCVWPPLPGVTPPTTFVPYSTICLAWKVPSLPVSPWTISRVFLSTSTLNSRLQRWCFGLRKSADYTTAEGGRLLGEPAHAAELLLAADHAFLGPEDAHGRERRGERIAEQLGRAVRVRVGAL